LIHIRIKYSLTITKDKFLRFAHQLGFIFTN